MTKLVLSEGHVSPDSPISVQLIKRITTPKPDQSSDHLASHVTECSPAKLGEVISNATRILSNASTELAAINAGRRT